MAKNIKLSVVVLVYNTEEYIRDCLDSLVNQTLDGLEIILVNDESPDNSLAIIEEYQAKYDNIKVINQKNSGGAVAGNNGMKIATGEYITVMDSDDIVPLDAYEKLYNKAKQTDADIVIGKPLLLINGMQREIAYQRENNVWKKERTITNIEDHPDLFNDGFYWNKIYKREFMRDNEIYMPPGMLYADRPMVHKAFLLAKKIVIITDIVYLWRKRDEEAAAKSITQLKNDLNNFLDRITSLEYQLEYFDKLATPSLKVKFLKENMDRLFFPISGILDNRQFRNVYLKEVKRILSQITDVYENDLGIIKNLYIFMILNDYREELIYFLAAKPNGEIIEENGIYYWALPFFRNETIPIPDELFQIKVLLPEFININSLSFSNNKINLSGLSVPEFFSIDKVRLLFQSRDEIDTKFEYPLLKSTNGYSIEMDINDLYSNNIVDTFDMYLYFEYNHSNVTFRITKKMVDNVNIDSSSKENKMSRLYFTQKENLTLKLTNQNAFFDLQADTKKISITTKEINDSLRLCVKERNTNNTVYFKKTGQNQFELKWSHFLDRYGFYDFYYVIGTKNYRLKSLSIKEFQNSSRLIDNIKVDIYKTENHNVSLKSYSKFNMILSKIKSIVK